MPTDDLDERIRALLGDAVAAAPAPHDLDAARPPVASLATTNLQRRWVGTAAAALTAAAAVVGLVLVVGRDTEPGIPASDVTSVATTAIVTPTTTLTPETTSPDTSTPDTTTPAVVPEVSTGVVTAGSDGVWVVDPDGSKVQWWNRPAAVAVRSPDGSLIVQQQSGNGDPCCNPDGGWNPASTRPLRLVGPNAYPIELSAEIPDGWLRLHDVARMPDGRVLALVEWQTTVVTGVDTAPGRLYAVDVTTGAAVSVDNSFGGWEEGSSRLHLAETGVIVGEYSSGITRSFYSAVVPGGLPLDTRPILPEQLGLEAGYDDCADCPQLYAIDRSGAVVAWLHGDDLVIRSLDTGTERRVPLDGRGAGAIDIDVAVVGGQAADGPLVVAIEYGGEAPNSIVIAVRADDSITEWPIGTPESISL